LLYLFYDRSAHPGLPNSVEARNYELSVAVSALDTPQLNAKLLVASDGNTAPSLTVATS
jgi:hypothetical protein